MKLFNIGYGSAISEEKILSVITTGSAGAKRLVSAAKERGLLIDATCGRSAKTVFVMDTGHCILSAKNFDEKDKENKGAE